MRFCLILLFALNASACSSSSEAPDNPESPPPEGGGGAASGSLCEEDDDCSDGLFCNGEESCEPDHEQADQRGCVPGNRPCDRGVGCEEVGEVCGGECTTDEDGDGFLSADCGGDDCDDSDVNRYPGNLEVCDELGRDEDCDPNTLGRDIDRDGHVDNRCCNIQADDSLLCGDDCDDLRDSVNPDALESCNEVDDDCDGDVDEDPISVFYVDMDGDGFGRPGDPDNDNLPPEERPVRACAQPAGYSPLDTDCNDDEPTSHPGAIEVCDARDIDEDCDGFADEFGEGALTPAVNLITYYEDKDGDGYGKTDVSQLSCNPTGDFRALVPGDCRDERPEVNPGVSELRSTPSCGRRIRLGDVLYPLAPMRCRSGWECVNDARRQCGQFASELDSNPELEVVWDYDCSGEIETQQARTCRPVEDRCEAGLATSNVYRTRECGITTVAEAYDCSSQSLAICGTVDGVESFGPVGAEIPAPCK